MKLGAMRYLRKAPELGPNYAFNPIAEQALRPNQNFVPQRVNAALGLNAVSPLLHHLPVENESVRLRAVTELDLLNWYGLETDSEVKRFVGGVVKQTEADWIKYYTGISIPSYCIIESRETCDFIGCAQLQWDLSKSSSLRVRILIARRAWGKSYGRSVLGLLVRTAKCKMHAREIVADIDPENLNSIKLAELFGFEKIRGMGGDSLKNSITFRLIIEA